MSAPQQPKPAKLVIGFFLKEKALLAEIAGDVSSRFGAIDFISAWMRFDCTSYYEAEMGAPLFRRIFAFKNMIPQAALAQLKIITNQIERQYTRDGKRRVNIDPGCLVPERFVLASGKNFSHRIYLAEGIYADLTLIYHHGGFRRLPWTYPDYADGRMRAILERIRNKYIFDYRG